MFKYALFVLLSITQVVISKKHFQIAPDKSSDSETFAVMEYDEITHQEPRKLSIELRIYNQQTDDYKQCSLNLTARWGAKKTAVSNVRRLTGDRIIFAWYDEMKDGVDRRTRIVTMNDNCRLINPIIDDLPTDPIILPSVANQYDLIVDDEVSCRSVGKRCRISYNLGHINNKVGRVWPFDVKLDWASMKVERLRNGDFLARGYDGTTYTILRVDHLTGANESLIVQFEANPQPDFVTSDLSICGITFPGYDKMIQCVQYGDDNEVTFQKRTTLDEPMKLIDVKSLGDGRMFVLVGKARCTDEFDCWKLFGVDVRDGVDNSNSRPSFSHFSCTGDRKDLRIFDVTLTPGDRVAVRYACKNDDDYNYNINYFDVDDGY